MVLVRAGRSPDAARLASLAARTFEETFGPLNHPEDMARYLTGAYGVAKQAAELADPAMATLLAEADGSLAGYAQLRDGPAPPCVVGPRPVELQRLYVDGPWQGRGVAQILIRAAMDEAGRRNAATLWLGVWERNARAQAFYRKCGFVDVGSQPFALGSARQTDRIMVRALP
ncbi:MAG TPA: GNAT family N-acetyltransferase [Gemmatimonadales bacterium]|nr:GNAT family N-acetyltransferase [Gemmatimonadales bacterium]